MQKQCYQSMNTNAHWSYIQENLIGDLMLRMVVIMEYLKAEAFT